MNIKSLSGETTRQESARSRKPSARHSMPDSQPEAIQLHEMTSPSREMNQEPRGQHGGARWLPKDYKQALDTVQRLVCIGLAVWVLIYMGNVLVSICYLAIGLIDARGAKEVLVRVLKSVVSDSR